MTTIILYKITCTKAYMIGEQGESYSLRPWGNNTSYYEGHDDGGKKYILPEEIEIGEDKYGETMLFDADGHHVSITVHEPSGRPQLVIGMHNMPVLDEYRLGDLSTDDARDCLVRYDYDWYVVQYVDGSFDCKNRIGLSSILECGCDPADYDISELYQCGYDEEPDEFPF